SVNHVLRGRVTHCRNLIASELAFPWTGLSAGVRQLARARGEWARTPAPRAGGGPAVSRLRETGFISASLRQELTDYKVRAVAPDVRGRDARARAGAGHELGVQQLTRDFFKRRRHQQIHAFAARQRAKRLSRIGFKRSH